MSILSDIVDIKTGIMITVKKKHSMGLIQNRQGSNLKKKKKL